MRGSLELAPLLKYLAPGQIPRAERFRRAVWHESFVAREEVRARETPSGWVQGEGRVSGRALLFPVTFVRRFALVSRASKSCLELPVTQ